MRPAKLAKYDHDYCKIDSGFTKLTKFDHDYCKIDIPFKTKFLDLNDDCVDHILKWLDVADLCRISDTNVRLRDIGNRHFKTYHSKYVSVGNPVNWTQNAIIKCFPEHIGKLKIDYWQYNNVLEQQIAVINSCSNGNIVHLKLLNFVLCDSSIGNIRNILKYAEKIEFKYSSMQGGINQLVLRNCPNLKHLTFKRCDKMNFTWLKTNYSTLDSLKIIRSGQLYESSVQSYFNKNPNIKQLTYSSLDSRPSIKWASQILLENIDKLKWIQLTGKTDDLFNYETVVLSQLGYLKELNIDFDRDWDENKAAVFINSIATHHTLEILGLFHLQWRLDDDLFQAMCNLIHLKVLKLSFATDFSKYIDTLSKKLINLESLYLYYCNINCEDVFTFIRNSMKLENVFLIQCRNLNWKNLKDNIMAMATVQRGGSGAVPLALHIYEHQAINWFSDMPREVHHKPFTVVALNRSTIKLIQLKKKDRESKLKETIAIGITFA